MIWKPERKGYRNLKIFHVYVSYLIKYLPRDMDEECG